MIQPVAQRKSPPYSLGRRIASRRVLLGLDQRALATALGVTPQALSQYERDQRAPRPTMLAAICRALDVSADWLLHGEESAA